MRDTIISEGAVSQEGDGPSLAINAVSNFVPLGLNIIIGFLLAPYLIGRLGMGNFGMWLLVGHFLGYYGLLRLGVGAGIMRYVPFYAGRNDQAAVSRITSTGMAIYICAGILILVTTLLIGDAMARFYGAGAELAYLIRILGAAAAIECPMRILDATVRAHEKWIPANLVTMASAVLRAAGLVICVHLGYGLIQMGYIVLLVAVSSLLLMGIVFVRCCPAVKIRMSLVSLAHIKRLVRFGLLTAVVSVVTTLRLQGHSLIIGKMISFEAVALYGVAGMLMRYAKSVVLAPHRVFWPRFAYLDGRNSDDGVGMLFRKGNRIGAAFATGVLLMIFTAGPSFIRLWVGAGFESVYPVMFILAVGYLVETSLTITGSFLAGTGRQGINAITAIIEGVLGLSLSIVLTPKFGLVGTASGFTVSVIIARGIICPLYICHLNRINVFRYYVETLAKPWLVLVLITSISHYFEVTKHLTTWPLLIGFVMGLGLPYMIITYFLIMDRPERSRLANSMLCISGAKDSG